MTAPDARRPPRLDELRWQDLAERMQRSERGRLLAPDLDDRRWQDIVDEASTLIEQYAPQWTDRNPSDIGMTLIELFAWLVESLIYRLNRVPEKNYIAFLNLLGITRASQVPARTLLTFAGAGPIGTGTPCQTRGSETEPPIVFETDTALTVIPASAVAFVRLDTVPVAGETMFPSVADQLRGPQPRGVKLRLPENEGAQIAIALKADTPQLKDVDVYVEPFREPVDRKAGELVEWLYAADQAPPDPPAPPPGAPPDPWRRPGAKWGPWRALEVISDGTGGLVRPGLVRLRVPGGSTWVAQEPKADARWLLPRPMAAPDGAHHWLGLRVTNLPARRPPDTEPAPNPPAATLDVRLDRLLLNTAPASSVSTVTDELVGKGTGSTHQVVRLAGWPVYARPGTDTPYGHVQVTVGGTVWRAVEDLPDGVGQCYLLDPVSGELTFGDHDPISGRGRGSMPAKDADIRASYRYVRAGVSGNVPASTVVVPATHPDGITAVTNPVRAFGGADEEPIEETKRRAPEALRYRGRAVTADDYEVLARAAAPGIAIVRCLPPRLHTDDGPQVDGRKLWLKGDPWTYGKLQRAPGVVNVVVAPDLGPDVPEPTPSLALVQDVIRVLDRRRAVATALHVTGPRYVRVLVRVEIEIFATALDEGRATIAAEEEKAEKAVRAFLHPVHGGKQGRGWQIGESVYTTDLFKAIRPAEDIGYLTRLDVAPEALVYGTSGNLDHQRPIKATFGSVANQVRIADYELVCCGTVTVDGKKEA